MLTINQVAEKLAVNHKTVRKLISAGELKAYKVAGQYRIDENDLQLFLSKAVVQTKIALPKKEGLSPGGYRYLKPSS